LQPPDKTGWQRRKDRPELLQLHASTASPALGVVMSELQHSGQKAIVVV